MRRVRKFVQIINSDYLDKLINVHIFCKQIELPQRQEPTEKLRKLTNKGENDGRIRIEVYQKPC